MALLSENLSKRGDSSQHLAQVQLQLFAQLWVGLGAFPRIHVRVLFIRCSFICRSFRIFLILGPAYGLSHRPVTPRYPDRSPLTISTLHTAKLGYHIAPEHSHVPIPPDMGSFN